jgi:hypothetical protein
LSVLEPADMVMLTYLHINAKLYFIDELYEIVNKSIFKDYERANLLKCETIPTVLIPKYDRCSVKRFRFLFTSR